MQESYNGFEIIQIEKDVLSIEECVKTAKKIESHINRNQFFIVLFFVEKTTVSASFFGFLMKHIQKLRKLKGELIIVAENPGLRHLIKTAYVDLIVPVYNSFKNFTSSYPEHAMNVNCDDNYIDPKIEIIRGA